MAAADAATMMRGVQAVKPRRGGSVPGEKCVSGSDDRTAKRRWGKKAVTNGKNRENRLWHSDSSSERIVVENNSLSGWEKLPKGMTDTGKAATSWVKYAQDNNLSPEQVQAGLTDIVRGD